ncbi:MAG: LPS export ABC transporter periplasmic protein LptC [Deltaproteobacteria bacterium]|nr:LPS export ABC transporter periplasmic protein LptC [Deltaproteobacteria bacterium]
MGAYDENGTSRPTVFQEINDGTYARAEGFTYTRTMDGRVEWEIRAGQAEYSEDRQTARFDKVEAVFYDENRREVRLTGPHGAYETNTQNIDVDGGVRVVSSLGYALETPSLRYTQDDRTISGDEQVFVRGEGFSLEGGRVSLRLEGEFLVLDGNVRGTIWKPAPPAGATP